MDKWVRRSLQAAMTAGAVGVGAVGMAHADDTTVVSPGVASDSSSTAGDNTILTGNSVSVPVVVPITGNKAAVTGIGAAVNGEDALLSLGLLGKSRACGSSGDDYTEVSPWVRSSSSSSVGDNAVLSGNSVSVPVVVPITGNDVAVAGIGAAANVENLVAALGILGSAHAGDCEDGEGNGDPEPYAATESSYSESSESSESSGSSYNEYAGSDETVVSGAVNSRPSSQVGDNSIASGNAVSVPVYAPVTGNDVSAAGIGGAVNADSVLAALGVVGKASATESDNGDAAGDSTVVAPTVNSRPSSQAGDNSVASGNAVSVPVVAPVTDNKVAATGVGGAVNAEDATLVGGLLGTASALLN